MRTPMFIERLIECWYILYFLAVMAIIIYAIAH